MTRRLAHLSLCAAALVHGCGDGEGGEGADDGAPGGAGEGAAMPDEPTGSGEITTIRIEVGEFTFDALAAGPETGEPVLLLHGFPETSHEWRAQLAALGEAGYRAVAPDQRGYSPDARPTEREAYLLPELAGDVFGMADALGFDRFHLVGHDWGAAVTWFAAATAPERLRSITPMSVPHPDAFAEVLNDPDSCQYSASSYFDILTAEDAAKRLLDGFIHAMWSGLPADARAHYAERFATEADLDPPLDWYRANFVDRMPVGESPGPVDVPTMFIWSDGDIALCVDGASRTGDHVTGRYRYEVLEGISHWIPEGAPEAVNALLLDHLGNYTID